VRGDETEDEIGERALPDAGTTDDRRRLTRREGETNAVEKGGSCRIVGEADSLQPHALAEHDRLPDNVVGFGRASACLQRRADRGEGRNQRDEPLAVLLHEREARQEPREQEEEEQQAARRLT